MVGVIGRRRRAVGLVAAIVAGVMMLPAGTSFAAAPQASCMGHEASSISPPGSSDEFPRGMPSLREFIGDNFPVPPGVVYRTIASLHEGSHGACDEALE
jgi:hypothetical protein